MLYFEKPIIIIILENKQFDYQNRPKIINIKIIFKREFIYLITRLEEFKIRNLKFFYKMLVFYYIFSA